MQRIVILSLLMCRKRCFMHYLYVDRYFVVIVIRLSGLSYKCSGNLIIEIRVNYYICSTVIFDISKPYRSEVLIKQDIRL